MVYFDSPFFANAVHPFVRPRFSPDRTKSAFDLKLLDLSLAFCQRKCHEKWEGEILFQCSTSGAYKKVDLQSHVCSQASFVFQVYIYMMDNSINKYYFNVRKSRVFCAFVHELGLPKSAFIKSNYMSVVS